MTNLETRHLQFARILAVAILLASWPAAAVHAAADAGSQALGSWRLTAALDASDIAALDEREARQLVGQVFSIQRDKVRFGSRTCEAPTLAAESVAPAPYLREQAHADASKLGLPNPVTVIELGCTIVFVKSQRRLVIYWKGWFFDAQKVPATSAARGQ